MIVFIEKFSFVNYQPPCPYVTQNTAGLVGLDVILLRTGNSFDFTSRVGYELYHLSSFG